MRSIKIFFNRNGKKLSECILDGSKKRKKGIGNYFTYNKYSNKKDDLCSCALGAALEGLLSKDILSYYTPDDLMSPGFDFYGLLLHYFPELENDLFFESDDRYTNNLYYYITYLNDEKQLSREEIANKLIEKGY